jgi:hypothetical protein
VYFFYFYQDFISTIRITKQVNYHPRCLYIKKHDTSRPGAIETEKPFQMEEIY